MRVLHLLSNYKWTGPSDPAVSLVASLLAEGVDVTLRSSGYLRRAPFNYLAVKARALGVEAITDLHLGKHRSWLRNPADVRKLARILAQDSFALVHCHLDNDFRIARQAIRRLRGHRPLLVRTVYETDPEAIDARWVESLAEAQAVLAFSKRVQSRLLELGLPADRLHSLDPAIDLDRFSPHRPLADLRSEFGFRPDDFLVGIVARVQPQRRFDLLLDLAEQVSATCPRFRLLILGRGSQLETVAREPARQRGLLDRVVFFPGFFEGDRYVAALRMLDVKLFLVPGTDGTARAVREALAMGLPVICTARGMLTELVRHGETGLVCEETPQAFAAAVCELERDPQRRSAMASCARLDAEARFSPSEQARRVVSLYDRLVGG
ncbi:MAG: glycosyltransferase family 4 protein [Planctomycetota bacterium]